jgi:putative flavoprotein involved in K+ transport
MNEYRDVERVSTLVIGGGQAGLAMGYQLARRNLSYRILDANQRIDVAHRWTAAFVHSAQYAGLRALFLYGGAFPTKDDLADYLRRMPPLRLPVQTGIKVRSSEMGGFWSRPISNVSKPSR